MIAMAEGLGAGVGPVVKISDSDSTYSGNNYMIRENISPMASSAVVVPEEVSVSAEVNVVLQLISIDAGTA